MGKKHASQYANFGWLPNFSWQNLIKITCLRVSLYILITCFSGSGKKAIAELLLNEQKFRYCFFNVQLLAIHCLSYTDEIKLFLFNN